MEADISGPQRKVVESSVAPLRPARGSSGIALRGDRTAPFRVRRVWSAPAGHYLEAFYLIDPETREVLFEGPQRETLVLGLQARTEIVDEIREPIALEPGSYEAVFVLGGVMGGTLPVEAFAESERAA